ncbi:MAG TPA: recombinase family protein [Dongiaceae bacterium]|nr:recombinase family protein [Dongiaceae bacterium]
MAKYVSYIRVSTDKQGKSGLGLEAQREAVAQFVRARGGEIISPEYREIESGKVNDRPELTKALKRCKLTGATLVVAKLDRLSRDLGFLMTLRNSGVDFVACDLPEANTLTIAVMGAMAQHERELISQRTKAALAQAKARGTKLGGLRQGAADITAYKDRSTQALQAKADEFAESMREVIEPLKGQTLQAIADQMNTAGYKTPRGKIGSWTPTTVRNVLARL